MDETSETQGLFIIGLNNEHAMESQAPSVMRPPGERRARQDYHHCILIS